MWDLAMPVSDRSLGDVRIESWEVLVRTLYHIELCITRYLHRSSRL
jgi:hypothetical protein